MSDAVNRLNNDVSADKENAVDRKTRILKRPVSRKTALRTKSANYIGGSSAPSQGRQLESRGSFNEPQGNFNKAQKTLGRSQSYLGRPESQKSVARTESYRFDPFADKENVVPGLRKLCVPRDSPEFARVRKVQEEVELDDDFDEDEIECVPVAERDLVDDGYQEMPKKILDYVFAHKAVEKSALDAFKDPIGLDMSQLSERSASSSEADLSQLGLEVQLEFPEAGEETEQAKLCKIQEYYEENRDEFKPKRL